MTFESWLDDRSQICEGEYNINRGIAERCARRDDFNFLAKSYTHIGPNEIITLLLKIHNAKEVFLGKGIDLGGGPGIIASSIARGFDCSIDFVEIVKEIIDLGFPIVTDYFGASIDQRVYPIVGSFDEIKRDDNNYDFCIAWDALHHSNDPIKTLKEAHRVTQPGGSFVLVDRVHNNSTSTIELNAMMDKEYPKDFLIENHLNPDISFTRRQNGEHEYRFRDLKNFFEEAGWTLVEHFLVLEKHDRNKFYKNDFVADQIFVDFEIGGYERRKLILVARKL